MLFKEMPDAWKDQPVIRVTLKSGAEKRITGPAALHPNRPEKEPSFVYRFVQHMSDQTALPFVWDVDANGMAALDVREVAYYVVEGGAVVPA